MLEMQIRRTTVLADAHARSARRRAVAPAVQREAIVRVGAAREEWTYTDSNGVKWSFTDQADDVPAGQRFVGSTEGYPESTYKFYEATSDELAATVEKIARSKASSASYSVGGGEEPTPGGGQAKTTTAPASATPAGAAPGKAPGDAPAPPGGAGGIGQKFSALSTAGKVGVIALVVLATGGIAWAIL